MITTDEIKRLESELSGRRLVAKAIAAKIAGLRKTERIRLAEERRNLKKENSVCIQSDHKTAMKEVQRLRVMLAESMKINGASGKEISAAIGVSCQTLRMAKIRLERQT